jgi:hypothetical protein
MGCIFTIPKFRVESPKNIPESFARAKDILHTLACVNYVCPLVGLAEAAALLAQEIPMSFVCIVGTCDDYYVTLALDGISKDDVDKVVVHKGNFPWKGYKGSLKIVAMHVPNETYPCGWIAFGGISDHDDFFVDLICESLLSRISNNTVRKTCQILTEVSRIDRDIAFLQKMAMGLHDIMLMETNIDMGVRIAIMKNDAAIIFEDNSVMEIFVENTLLSDAVENAKARYLSDCALYMQSCLQPVTDIFISPERTVASLVVFPFDCSNMIGGVYFTMDKPNDFSKIKDNLVGVMAHIAIFITQRCESNIDAIWSEAHRVSGNVCDKSTMQPRITMYQRHNCTEAMLKLFNNEIHNDNYVYHYGNEWVKELQLTEMIGKGGFGMVYKGTWRGMVAAIKIMYNRQHERQLMKDAIEIAVLMNISHPHIVALYTCMVDMVQEDIRFRKPYSGESSWSTCNLIIMEYCDGGNLRTAINNGLFLKMKNSSHIGILQVLLEVALGIQYLHAMRMMHCDIKPENILLKMDSTNTNGFVAKLSDFGLAKLLRDHDYILNCSGSGTVTHLAPELFLDGSRITYFVDSYAFGIMMWEIYTSKRVYGEIENDKIIDYVLLDRSRPEFPLDTPKIYSDMAKKCWSENPGDRPNFTQILSELRVMMKKSAN